jgi:hypothetical protein
MTDYWDGVAVERLERLVSSLENQVVVNVGWIISTAAQVQTVVKSEQLAFPELLWILARGGALIYNPIAIANLTAPGCLLMLKIFVYQYLIPYSTAREEASNYKRLFTEGLVGLTEAENALHNAMSI